MTFRCRFLVCKQEDPLEQRQRVLTSKNGDVKQAIDPQGKRRISTISKSEHILFLLAQAEDIEFKSAALTMGEEMAIRPRMCYKEKEKRPT